MKKLIQLISLSVLLSFGGIVNTAIAADGYNVINPAQLTQTGDKIEVLEIFWYGCSHCYNFEPHIKEWLQNKPDGVEFRRMPGIFRKNWVPHAKAYYTAEKLGVLDKIHGPLFDAIHKEKKKIYDDDAIKKFFIKQGINKKDFTKVYESEEINIKAKQAFLAGQQYKTRTANGKVVPALQGVPSIIVNGKYIVSGSTAGSFENVLKITNSLVDKEKASTVASE